MKHLHWRVLQSIQLICCNNNDHSQHHLIHKDTPHEHKFEILIYTDCNNVRLIINNMDNQCADEYIFASMICWFCLLGLWYSAHLTCTLSSDSLRGHISRQLHTGFSPATASVMDAVAFVSDVLVPCSLDGPTTRLVSWTNPQTVRRTQYAFSYLYNSI